jgi:hypothetical protein
MGDYNTSKIYKLVSIDSDDIYIGSTIQPLSTRLSRHESDYKLYLNGKHRYITSFKILETNNYDIVLIEEFPCKSKQDLHERERYHIENNNCVNKNIPSRTAKEYYQQNKDKKSEYYQQNKDKILDYQSEYRQQNKDKITEYRQQNKDKIKEYQKEKIECNICGCKISRNCLSKHKRTNKCLTKKNSVSNSYEIQSCYDGVC